MKQKVLFNLWLLGATVILIAALGLIAVKNDHSTHSAGEIDSLVMIRQSTTYELERKKNLLEELDNTKYVLMRKRDILNYASYDTSGTERKIENDIGILTKGIDKYRLEIDSLKEVYDKVEAQVKQFEQKN